MSNFIDALDLTKEDEERVDPKLTFNPSLQYFAQVVSHKIAHPELDEGQNNDGGEAKLPELNQNIVDYVRPDREMFEGAQQEISAFEEAFELEEIEEEEGV